MKERMERVDMKDAINNNKKLRKEIKIMTACTREFQDECESIGLEIKPLEKINTLL